MNKDWNYALMWDTIRRALEESAIQGLEVTALNVLNWKSGAGKSGKNGTGRNWKNGKSAKKRNHSQYGNLKQSVKTGKSATEFTGYLIQPYRTGKGIGYICREPGTMAEWPAT